MDDLGVSVDECQKKIRSEFERKGLDTDVIDLRYRHYQGRLIDTLNRIIEQRRKIKISQAKEMLRHQNANTSQGSQPTSTRHGGSIEKMPKIFAS
mmetsp:Transcript_24660/g.38349  ORF Transcript_24660/g.38349 Transcript_24660/m.38349 type:complete len:95 (+) Transcript_24660:170-454(+)